ncbi:TonB-dependent receptor [Sphingomonas flavalba]|uniref:TonB-dependent receptor n=1 Tax=Sphingomonas flavalba TaxID=2559804 RepID=UPI00109E2913|nr:TonB-dependent receptor [Sphingomonas flavalba]
MRKFLSTSALCSAAACLLVPAVPAWAQASASGDDGLADIIVTAEKRPSIAQRTSIALTVVDAEALKRQGVGNVADLTTLTPSVNFATNGPSSIVTIRGVSSRDTNQLGDPAVSISIDGFYLQRALGLNAALFDLERVEALRGPQGTLLGRNATGGALSIVSAKPLDHFAASATVEYGNYDTFNTQGFVNIPLAEGVKMRASFQTRDRDGYRNNAPGRDADDEHSKAARIHVQFDPTPEWTLLITGEYAQTDGTGPGLQAIPWRYIAGTTNVDYSKPPIPNDGKTFPSPPGQFLRTQTVNFRWNTSYDFGPASITYLGGYREFKLDRLNGLGAPFGTARQNFSFDQSERPNSWNHELRITSAQDQPLLWQAGLYHFSEKNSTQSLFADFPGSPGLFGPANYLQIFVKPDLLLKSSAAFGQASYAVTDTLRLEAGLRYSKDNKHNLSATNLATNVGNYIATGVMTPYVSNPPTATEIASSKVTYHAAANLQWTPQNLLYVKYDTGYKAGGFTDLNPYGPESLTAYEIGSKNRFLGNTLQINASAFLYDYKNQQVQQQIQLPSGGVGTGTVNAGKSKIYGADLDLIWQPSSADRFDFYIAYLHARFKDFVVFSGGNQQLAGNRLQQAPDWTMNIGYEHTWDVGDGTLTARAQTHYESKSYFTFFNFDADKQSGYHRSDVTLTYRAPDDRWALEAYVRNLEDKLILAYADVTGSTWGTYRYTYQAPRTFGARLTVNF